MIMLMVPAAILTIAALNILLAPLMHGTGRQKLLGWALLVVTTVAAIGLYLARGEPGIASAPALFETKGPRYEQRQFVKKELELAERLTEAPEDTALMLELGAVRLQNGRLAEAIAILGAAHDMVPKDKAISTKLGAAHYAAALAAFLLEDDKAAAERHFARALQIAPQDAPYRERLVTDIAKFRAAP